MLHRPTVRPVQWIPIAALGGALIAQSADGKSLKWNEPRPVASTGTYHFATGPLPYQQLSRQHGRSMVSAFGDEVVVGMSRIPTAETDPARSVDNDIVVAWLDPGLPVTSDWPQLTEAPAEAARGWDHGPRLAWDATRSRVHVLFDSDRGDGLPPSDDLASDDGDIKESWIASASFQSGSLAWNGTPSILSDPRDTFDGYADADGEWFCNRDEDFCLQNPTECEYSGDPNVKSFSGGLAVDTDGTVVATWRARVTPPLPQGIDGCFCYDSGNDESQGFYRMLRSGESDWLTRDPERINFGYTDIMWTGGTADPCREDNVNTEVAGNTATCIDVRTHTAGGNRVAVRDGRVHFAFTDYHTGYGNNSYDEGWPLSTSATDGENSYREYDLVMYKWGEWDPSVNRLAWWGDPTLVDYSDALVPWRFGDVTRPFNDNNGSCTPISPLIPTPLPPTNVSTKYLITGSGVPVVNSQGTVYTFWKDDTSFPEGTGGPDIWVRTWKDHVRESDVYAASRSPLVAGSNVEASIGPAPICDADDWLHLVYTRVDGIAIPTNQHVLNGTDIRVFYATHESGAFPEADPDSWGWEIPLTDSGVAAFAPSITESHDGDRLHLVWTENVGGATAAYEVKYRMGEAIGDQTTANASWEGTVFLDSDFVVDSGHTLTIADDTVVYVQSHVDPRSSADGLDGGRAELIVKGSLVLGANVRFRGTKGTDDDEWGGVHFRDSVDTATLEATIASMENATRVVVGGDVALDSDLYVPEPNELVILAGATIEVSEAMDATPSPEGVSPDIELIVQGELLADASSGSPILLRVGDGTTSATWRGLRVLPHTDNPIAVIRNVTIEDATVGISAVQRSVEIETVTVSSPVATGIEIVDGPMPIRVDGSTVTGGVRGIQVVRTHAADITANLLENCDTGMEIVNVEPRMARSTFCIQAPASPVTFLVDRNTVKNAVCGIAAIGVCDRANVETTISRSKLDNCGVGLRFDGSEAIHSTCNKITDAEVAVEILSSPSSPVRLTFERNRFELGPVGVDAVVIHGPDVAIFGGQSGTGKNVLVLADDQTQNFVRVSEPATCATDCPGVTAFRNNFWRVSSTDVDPPDPNNFAGCTASCYDLTVATGAKPACVGPWATHGTGGGLRDELVEVLALRSTGIDRGRWRFGLEVPGGRGRATLEVYDVQGRRVHVLFDSEVDAPRTEVVWDTADTGTPSGVYFARLRSAGEVVSRRVVVVR